MFVLNLIDTLVAGYPLLLVGLCQVIVVPWIYGSGRLCKDIECMIGKRPAWFWTIWIISWKYICPTVITASSFN